MREINVSVWNRKAVYDNFIQYDNPIFSITSRLDVTELCRRCKEKKTSFFADFLYIVMVILNDEESLRIRIKEGKPVIYDEVCPSFIVIKDDESISTCGVRMSKNYSEFYKDVREAIEKTRNGGPHDQFNDQRNDLVFISCLPWLDICNMSNPYDNKNSEMSSIPRITWGKFVDEGNRKKMTFDIAVHHALTDGYQICRVINNIQGMLNDLHCFKEVDK